MRATRLVIALVLLAAAVVVALLAADVRASATAVATGDAVYESGPASAVWTASTRLPASLSRGLLGLQDDLAARRALQGYRATVGLQGRLDNAVDVAAARGAAEAALAAVAREPGSARASQAETLLAVLAFGDFSQGAQTGQMDEALAALEEAVKLDPGNVAAKYDLELLLRLSAARGTRSGSQAGSGFGPGRDRAAGGAAGSGY